MPNFDALNNSAFLDAVASLPERKKNDGQGRAADEVARKFGVSVSTVYQARSVIKNGNAEIVRALRDGVIPVKTAYKLICKKENVMNINGYEELSYLKNSESLLKEIKNVEKTLDDAGYEPVVSPRFYLENNKISFDIRVSFSFPQARSDGKPAK